MPIKLFSRKKAKKKAKLSVRNALTPTSAFVAVPSTPPPASPDRSGSVFTFPDNPPPQPTTPVHQVLVTSQENDGLSPVVPFPQENVGREATLNSESGDGAGTYSLAGPPDDLSDEEEPGYATVRAPSYYRPRLPSPPVTSLPPPHPTSSITITSLPSTLPTSFATVTSLPSTHSNSITRPLSDRDKVFSTSDLPSVTNTLSDHSDSSDHVFLSPAPTSKEDFPNQNHTQAKDGKSHQRSVSFTLQLPELTREEPESPQLTEEDKMALYAKVNKLKKGNSRKEDEKDSTDQARGHQSHSQNHHPKSSNKTHQSKSIHSPKVGKRTNHQHPYGEGADQGYLQSSEESSSSLESNNATVSRQRNRSHSISLPSYQPPAKKHLRPSRHVRRKSTGAIFEQQPPRPASSLEHPLLSADKPELQSGFIQQQSSAFVFSEQLPDGRVQYYTATPVQMFTPHSAPLINGPHSRSQPVSHSMHVPGLNSEPGGGIDTYSLARRPDDLSDEEEPGYATVRTSPFYQPGLSSLPTTSSTPVTSLPSSHQSSITRQLAVDMPDVHMSTLSDHSDSSDDIVQPSSPLTINGEFPNHSNTESEDRKSHQHDVSFTQQSPEFKRKQPESAQLTQEDRMALYAKVKKQKQNKKDELSIIDHNHQPKTKDKSKSTEGHQSQSHFKHTHSSERIYQSKAMLSPKITKETKHRHPPRDKLPNIEENGSLSCQGNQNYLSHSINAPSHHSRVTCQRNQDRLSHSISLPIQQLHFKRSSQRRTKSTEIALDHRSNRSASFSGDLLLSADTPKLQPGFTQQRSMRRGSLPDGRVQHYAIAPLQALTPHTSPPINCPPPHTSTPHTPSLINHPHSTTPTTQTHPQYEAPLHRPISHHYVRHTDPGSNQEDATHPILGKTPTNLAESGYFSNTASGANAQASPPHQSVNVKPGGAGPAMLVTPTQHSSLLEQSQQNGVDEASVSPQVKLLESSLQRATFSSLHTHSHSTLSPLPKGKPPVINIIRGSPHKDQYHAQQESKETDFKAHMEELEALNRELKRENASLKQICESMRVESSGSIERLQSKITSLLSENNNLKETSRDKEAKIRQLEDEVTRLKSELISLSEENKALLTRQQDSLEERGEWERVASHAHSVLDENASLVKSQEVQRKTIKQLKGEHQAIVSQLNGEISKLQKERQASEETLSSLRQSHTQLLMKFDELSARSARQVPLEEHQSVLVEMQRLVEELDESNKREMRSQEAKMRISDKDKRCLVTKLTDAKAIIYQLEEEVAKLHKEHRQAREKVLELQHDLEQSRDKEVNLHSQLNRAVVSVERATSERDTFAKIAKSQEQAKERAVAHGVKREVVLGKLERKLESQKYHQLEQASIVLQEQDREHKHQRDQYRREIANLKSLLAKKQAYVDKLIKADTEEH